MSKELTPEEQFLEQWYGSEIPKTWDKDFDKMQNISINDLCSMLKEYAAEIAEEKPLKEQVFDLANKLAVAGYGDQAVKMHQIHNSLALCRCECSMPNIDGRGSLCGKCEKPII